VSKYSKGINNEFNASGYCVKVKVNNLKSSSELDVTDGRDSYKDDAKTLAFRPRGIPYDAIIIEGHSGYLSLQTLHWLSRNNISVFAVSFDGSILSSIMPPTPTKVDVKLAQMKAASQDNVCKAVSHALIRAKIERSLQVLEWLAKKIRYTKATTNQSRSTFIIQCIKQFTKYEPVKGITPCGGMTPTRQYTRLRL
jgi:CRISPR-associated protein Cas1